MPEAARSMLEAAERRSLVGEDRLTEIFAFALTRDEALLRDLCAAAGVPFGPRYRITTQRVSGDDRIDMEIALRDETGRAVGWLLCEHKDDMHTQWQPEQLPRYAEEAERLGAVAPARVLAIVPEVTMAEPHERWERLSWAQIAAWIQDHARREARSPRHWRTEAADPAAPALAFVRNELITYLENRGLVRLEALQAVDVIVAERIHDTLAAVDALLGACVTQDDTLTANGRIWYQPAWPGWRYQAFAADGYWARDYGGYPEVFFAPTDDWLPEPDRRHQPAFAAGFTFYPRTERALEAASGVARRGEVRFLEHGEALRLARVRYLADVALAGAYFDEQAEAFAAWARKAIADVNACPPGRTR